MKLEIVAKIYQDGNNDNTDELESWHLVCTDEELKVLNGLF